MSVLRFLLRSAVMFIGGMISFFLLVIAIVVGLGLLAVGLTCAVFMVWTVIHWFAYYALHDRQAWHRAMQSILIAAGCFGFIVLTASTVTDVFLYASGRRKRMHVSLELPAREGGHV